MTLNMWLSDEHQQTMISSVFDSKVKEMDEKVKVRNYCMNNLVQFMKYMLHVYCSEKSSKF